jgi:hypothetical protein
MEGYFISSQIYQIFAEENAGCNIKQNYLRESL